MYTSEFMYLWCSLCALHLLSCQVRVTVGNSGLCCFVCVMPFKRWLTPLCVEFSVVCVTVFEAEGQRFFYGGGEGVGLCPPFFTSSPPPLSIPIPLLHTMTSPLPLTLPQPPIPTPITCNILTKLLLSVRQFFQYSCTFFSVLVQIG